MTKKDWLCPICGATMEKISDFMFCVKENHGKLRNLFNVMDLPPALHAGSRIFSIGGEKGCWKYVPFGHKEALNKAPAEGEIVARVVCRGKWQARLFRRTK